jgi:alkylation response protein AidB-like acyl-CoA dehydrogenase
VIDYRKQVEDIAASVVADHASRVDEKAEFPQASIEALAKGGLFGLISAKEMGGMGEGPRAAAFTVERLARECGSTAMVMCMHYAGTSVIETFGPEPVRREIASGKHLSTLAFSEVGSRSQFWAPVSSAERKNGHIVLQAQKSWVTSAHHAEAYVWSSRPIGADGASTIWLVPRRTDGVEAAGQFNGLGLRGNDSTPVRAEHARLSPESMLGKDGQGLDIMLGTVLPIFNVLTAAVSVGLMEGATSASSTHAAQTRFDHSSSSLADLPTLRAYLARMRIATDQARCLLHDTLDAMENGRGDAMLRILECKAAAGESATSVLDLAMRVCGGAAFRKEIGVERRFRDGRAGTVMAPTTDQLYDFIGKAICGLPVF